MAWLVKPGTHLNATYAHNRETAAAVPLFQGAVVLLGLASIGFGFWLACYLVPICIFRGWPWYLTIFLVFPAAFEAGGVIVIAGVFRNWDHVDALVGQEEPKAAVPQPERPIQVNPVQTRQAQAEMARAVAAMVMEELRTAARQQRIPPARATAEEAQALIEGGKELEGLMPPLIDPATEALMRRMLVEGSQGEKLSRETWMGKGHSRPAWERAIIELHFRGLVERDGNGWRLSANGKQWASQAGTGQDGMGTPDVPQISATGGPDEGGSA